MPEKRTTQEAKKALRQGKRPTTAAGPFVREEMEHARSGKHRVRSRKQAIAIGLSKARRAGVPLPPRGKRTRAKTSRARSSTRRSPSRRSSTRRRPARRSSRR